MWEEGKAVGLPVSKDISIVKTFADDKDQDDNDRVDLKYSGYLANGKPNPNVFGILVFKN